MSLLSTASAWVSEQPKKKGATIRKTINKPQHIDEEVEDEVENGDVNDRNNRVASLLEKMTSMNVVDDAGSNLTNFQPLDYPENQQRQPTKEPLDVLLLLLSKFIVM